MSNEPSAELSRPVRPGRAKLVAAAFLLAMVAATATGLVHARTGTKPEAPAPAPMPSIPGWQGLVVADIDCQDDPATCQRIRNDPALADKLTAQVFGDDIGQFVARVEAAFPENPGTRTACGPDDRNCEPPSAAEIRQALTAAGISDFDMRTTAPQKDSPNGGVVVGIRHGFGCVIVRAISSEPVIPYDVAQPNGTCLPA